MLKHLRFLDFLEMPLAVPLGHGHQPPQISQTLVSIYNIDVLLTLRFLNIWKEFLFLFRIKPRLLCGQSAKNCSTQHISNNIFPKLHIFSTFILLQMHFYINLGNPDKKLPYHKNLKRSKSKIEVVRLSARFFLCLWIEFFWFLHSSDPLSSGSTSIAASPALSVVKPVL